MTREKRPRLQKEADGHSPISGFEEINDQRVNENRDLRKELLVKK